jgi:hypothetical protein
MNNDIQELKERLTELYKEINRRQRSWITYELELKEMLEIEDKLVNSTLKLLNDEFINDHKWEKKHMNSLNPWDIIIYKGTVSRIFEVGTTDYIVGMDVFNYRANLSAIFLKVESSIDFGYYDMVEVLN